MTRKSCPANMGFVWPLCLCRSVAREFPAGETTGRNKSTYMVVINWQNVYHLQPCHGFNLHSISAPVFNCYWWCWSFPFCRSCRRWVHMLILGFATFEHNYRFYSRIYIVGRAVYYCMKVWHMSCHVLGVICCQKCTQTNSKAIRFVDICKAKTLLCNYDVHMRIFLRYFTCAAIGR